MSPADHPSEGSAMHFLTRLLPVLAVGCAALSPAAHAQVAGRPIVIVVAYAAGGGTDLNARLIAQKMTENMGRPVIVENRPGAGSMIAADYVAKAPKDGNTLLLSGLTTYAAVPSLYKNAPYQPLRDFAPVALTGSFGMVLAVDPKTNIHSLKDFLAAAKAPESKMAFGSAGGGSSNQLAMELLMQQGGFRITHVPYKGSSAAMNDLLSGVLPAMFVDLATATGQIKENRIRVIATANRTRATSLPDVPTVAEAGMPGYEMSVWQGVVAPAGTPREVVVKLNEEINRAMADPATAAKLAQLGIQPLSGTPEDFSAFMKKEYDKWTDVIVKGKIQPD
jgi:tripartite-type tricarboxylate transporter receptor subunit TctC